MIASRKHRQYRGILPSGSTWWAPSSRMCSLHLCSGDWGQHSPSIHPNCEKKYLESALQNLPELFRLSVAGILNIQVPSLRHDLLGCEGSLGGSPPRVGPPLLDSRHLFQVELLFRVGVYAHIVHIVKSHIVNGFFEQLKLSGDVTDMCLGGKETLCKMTSRQ